MRNYTSSAAAFHCSWVKVVLLINMLRCVFATDVFFAVMCRDFRRRISAPLNSLYAFRMLSELFKNLSNLFHFSVFGP